MPWCLAAHFFVIWWSNTIGVNSAKEKKTEAKRKENERTNDGRYQTLNLWLLKQREWSKGKKNSKRSSAVKEYYSNWFNRKIINIEHPHGNWTKWLATSSSAHHNVFALEIELEWEKKLSNYIFNILRIWIKRNAFLIEAWSGPNNNNDQRLLICSMLKIFELQINNKWEWQER